MAGIENGALVRINEQDPREHAHGQVGRLICERPRDLAGRRCFLVDFGLRGSLVVLDGHCAAYAPSIDGVPA